MFFKYKLLLFIIVNIHCLFPSIRAKTFFVSNYGAYSNDNIDDSKAIQETIQAAINYGFSSTISFGSGIYNLSSTIQITNATNLTITGQGMDQTILIGNKPMTLFAVEYCNGLIIRSLAIDFDPLPFTAGTIVNVNDSYIDIRVQPPHRTDIGRQVQNIFRFDPIAMRPAYGPNTFDMYQLPPTNANTSIVTPGVLRIPMAYRTKLAVDETIVLVYAPRLHAVLVHDSIDLTIQSVTLHTPWYMGLYTKRVRRINIIDYHAKPNLNHWLSLNADCMHLSDSRESIHIYDSKCELQGDDGLNVHAEYFIVTEIVNSSAIILSAFNWTGQLNIENGIYLEFSSHNQPFTSYTTGKIASSSFDSSMSQLFVFTNSINVSIGDYACVADTPSLTIRNFTVERNRARGILVETRNVDIRNSIFNHTSGAAFLFQPSLYYHEGPTGRNVTLTNNLYIQCNEGIGQFKGIIAVLPYPPQLVPVINDIRIESSSFYFGNYSQGLVGSTNANNVYITGNYIVTNSSSPLVSICNSRNITASNNTVIDRQGKIEQYYKFDETNPCQMNLSSLIDLPPSAFNSSFAPPVASIN